MSHHDHHHQDHHQQEHHNRHQSWWQKFLFGSDFHHTGTGAERSQKEIAERAETQVESLTYSAELHRNLRLLWLITDLTGRLPFRVIVNNNVLTVKVQFCSFAFLSNLFTCIFLWVAVLWVSVGCFYVAFTRSLTVKEGLQGIARQQGTLLEYRLLNRFWLDFFIFYTTLFHLAFVTTHQCVHGRDYALFFKNWYKTLDKSKVVVYHSLLKFYLILCLLGILLILAMIIVYALREEYPFMLRSLQVIVITVIYPFHAVNPKFIPENVQNLTSCKPPKCAHVEWAKNYTDPNRFDSKRNAYFENVGYEIIALVFYCWVVLVTWQNSVLHLTFSRCFRNGIRLLNERVQMVLMPNKVALTGPNAVRVTAQDVQSDYVHVTAAGMMQNKVFGAAILSDMMWTVLTLFFEVMRLTFYGFEVPGHPDYQYRWYYKYEGTNISQRDPPLPTLLNLVGHIGVTVVRLVIVIWFPDLVVREAHVGYRYVTSKGLLLCETQLLRNFVRSMWLISVPKFPIQITADNYFKLTRGMLCAMLSAIATYYIFAMQAKGDLERLLLGGYEDNIEDLYNATGLKHIPRKTDQ